MASSHKEVIEVLSESSPTGSDLAGLELRMYGR